jgi:hypothetical protein
MSGSMLLHTSTIGGASADQVYNGVENLAFTGDTATITNCTFQYCGLASGNALALLGQPGTSATVTGTAFSNCRRAVLLSEAAPNVTLSGCTFTDLTAGAIILSRLGLYPTELPTANFDNLTVDGCTFTNAGDCFIPQGQAVDGLAFDGNTVGTGSILLSGNFSGMTNFTVANTTFTSGGRDVANYSGKVALWTNSTRGTGALLGVNVNNFGTGASTPMIPLSDKTWLNGNNNAPAPNVVTLDSSLLTNYPTGFRTTLKITNTNWVLGADAAWNTFASNVPVTEGLTIEKNGGGKFAVL